MGRAEREVFETALAELKPGEVKDLFRLARPASGRGLGWSRVFEDLATRAGEKAITGDVISAYVREQAGSNWASRALWRAKAGTADFFANGLSFFGRERFRKKVAAELFNELRMTTDFKAARELAQLMRAAEMPAAARKLASDAFFYTFTSFSPRTQRAFLEIVKKEGWASVNKKLRQEIIAAMRAKAADPVGTGIINGLCKMMPKYSVALRSAPIHRLMEYGVFITIGPPAFDALISSVQSLRAEMKAGKGTGKEIKTVENLRNEYFKAMDRYYGGEEY
jgi:hypothetical protein